jgi:hypothetical protein
MKNRRSSNRYLCSDLVEVVYRNECGTEVRHLANLEDISYFGMCLQMDQEIASGTLVTMRCQNGVLLGTVRNARYSECAYFHGIEFNDLCRWSAQVFQPGYLFDLGEYVPQLPDIEKPASNPQAAESFPK